MGLKHKLAKQQEAEAQTGAHNRKMKHKLVRVTGV
jgi:hypothetical protein